MVNRENPSSRENEQGRNKKNIRLRNPKNQNSNKTGDKKNQQGLKKGETPENENTGTTGSGQRQDDN